MLKYIAIMSLLGGFTPTLAATPATSGLSAVEITIPVGEESAAFISKSGPNTVNAPKAIYLKTVTAFSSSPEETDSTPFITASGGEVHEGTAAANWLPFGTKIRIPKLFGNKVFTIEDRMNARYSDRLDIWFPEKNQAKDFGMQTMRVEVL
jgi:3D (Asp-Asp-Asp) domain-containing protein